MESTTDFIATLSINQFPVTYKSGYYYIGTAIIVLEEDPRHQYVLGLGVPDVNIRSAQLSLLQNAKETGTKVTITYFTYNAPIPDEIIGVELPYYA